MPKVVNLNKLISGGRGPKKIGDSTFIFDTVEIQKYLISRIKNPDTHFVMGCAAWFTNTKIIQALSTLKGVSIICTRDKVARTKVSRAKYKTLKKHSGIPTINLLGAGRGRSASLMHHKFLIGLDRKENPIWISTGSFNLTESACTNLENLQIIENPQIATVYLKEFQRLFRIAKPLHL